MQHFETERFQCTKCNSSYKRKDNLVHHMRVAHPAEVLPLVVQSYIQMSFFLFFDFSLFFKFSNVFSYLTLLIETFQTPLAQFAAKVSPASET